MWMLGDRSKLTICKNRRRECRSGEEGAEELHNEYDGLSRSLPKCCAHAKVDSYFTVSECPFCAAQQDEAIISFITPWKGRTLPSNRVGGTLLVHLYLIAAYLTTSASR